MPNGRLIIESPKSGSLNMATDEALMRLVEEPVLRLYRWAESAVSIGYFQSWLEAPKDRPFVRRYTGGGLVDHAKDLTYSLILPKGHPLDARGTASSYQAIHEAVAEALKREGFQADVVPVADPEENAACFQRAVKYDVATGDLKLAGAAQRRTKQGTLHQGSILPPGGYDWDSLAHALEQTLTPLLASPTIPSQLTEDEHTLAAELVETRYGTEEWNKQK
ncbi:MAG: lipoate--protein ligase family protein [Verrucomicrobiota bacterium]